MLKILLKKQLIEVFRGYFYDAKKNRMRSKPAIALWIIFFAVVMVGMLGGIFTMLSLSLCEGLNAVGMAWMYFLLMGSVAILLGAFGSVFNTYSTLYLAKDNELLLALPIPPKTIMGARLIIVYLLGSMYAATAAIPAVIVYWIIAGVTFARVICGILWFVGITVIVLLLSCLLGFVVAKISLRLKNKSFITTLLALLFIAAYYFFYFKASVFIQDFIQNADVYGEKIKGAAHAFYLFGRAGEGDFIAAGLLTAIIAVVFWLIWTLMQRSFLKIATASGRTQKVRYTEKRTKAKSAFRALVGKELSRFTSSSNYMLNCGLSVLLIPAMGVFLLIKGGEILQTIDLVLAIPGLTAVLLCAFLCMLSVMNDMAAPSVSIEGKNIWIPQSLPVLSKTVLRAKACVQMILTGIPMLFTLVCTVLVLDASPLEKVFLCTTVLIYTVFAALFDLTLGVKMPLLDWTSEIVPIKQGGAVMIAIFGNWLILAVFIVLYFVIGIRIGAALYLLLWSILFGGASVFLMRYLDTKGAKIFASL